VCGPVHVTLKICRGLPNLRTPRAYRVLERCFRAGREKREFRLYQFSVQRDHLHLIVEANNRGALSRGMQGLAIRIAKGLNRYLHRRRGHVFAERYFARALEKPMQVWRAIRYVVNNARKHGDWSSRTQPDPFSSGRWLEGWRGKEGVRTPLRDPPLGEPHHYLTFSWKHWPIAIDAVPGPASFSIG
jgi:REP element-mobilizing transposase RayT